MAVPTINWLGDGVLSLFSTRSVVNRTAEAHQYGSGFVIGLIDTGLSTSQLPTGTREQLLSSVSLVGGRGTDYSGHGVAVASLMVSSSLGLAPQASIRSYRVSTSNRHISSAAVTEAVKMACRDGVDIINISLGSSYKSRQLQLACEAAHRMGIPVVSPVGNSENGMVRYPAAFETVFSVGSANKDNERSPFSSYIGNGPDLCGRGEQVVTLSRTLYLRQVSGTSYAASQVTASLCLAMAVAKWLGKPTHLDHLRSSFSQFCTLESYHDEVGWGCLDLEVLFSWVGLES